MSDPESTLVTALRALGGAAPGATEFDVVREGVSVHVGYSSGSSASVTLRAPFDAVRGQAPAATQGASVGYRASAARPLAAVRPLSIELRYESTEDRRHKRTGLNREVQTGDAAFDDEIYVNSPSDDPVVRAVLAPAPVRAAVRELLSLGFSRVMIDGAGEDVETSLNAFASALPQDERAARMITAFAALVAHLPRIERAPGRRPGDPLIGWAVLGNLLAAAGVFGGVPLYFSASPAGCVFSDGDSSNLVCHPGCCEPARWGLGLGVPLGIATAVLLRALLVQRLRGRSNSSSRVTYPAVVAGCVVAQLAVIIACAAWWL